MSGVVVSISFVDTKPTIPSSQIPVGAASPRHSLWQGIDVPSDYLILLGFPTNEAADDHLRQLIESQGTSTIGFALPDAVQHIAIEHEHGTVLDDVPIGGVVAVSKAMASPGYGEEARQRLEETIETFSQVPAYLGHILGANESMDDQAWTFVFADSETAIPTSDSAAVLVRLYRRVE